MLFTSELVPRLSTQPRSAAARFVPADCSPVTERNDGNALIINAARCDRAGVYVVLWRTGRVDGPDLIMPFSSGINDRTLVSQMTPGAYRYWVLDDPRSRVDVPACLA